MPSPKKKTGSKLNKSVVLQVRIDPVLRFNTELAARTEGRTLSSYIAITVQKGNENIRVDSFVNNNFYSEREFSTPTVMLSELSAKVWAESEAMRFFKLATYAPSLLTAEEVLRWRFIRKEKSYWRYNDETGEKSINRKFLRAMWNHLCELDDFADYDWELHCTTFTELLSNAPDEKVQAYKKALYDLLEHMN